jgi:predicted esterase
MRRIPSILACVACIVTAVATADEPGGTFQGEWRTTIGPVKLEQKGDTVTGTYGAGGQFPLKGNVKANMLTFEYEEGEAKGDGRFTLDPSGNAFTGGFQVRNGRGGPWDGWRRDPKAATDKLGTYAGLWLTDLGLMEITQDGAKVKGRYALRGTSTVEGKVTGRRLDFRFNSFREGQGWFDLAADGKTFAGASNADGFTGWFGWKGRLAPGFKPHVPLVAAKIVDGSTKSLLTYSVRAPEDYQPGSSRKWPTVLILHGSNMNGRSYVNTIASAWPDIARDFILLGINGETPSNISDDPRFNYSYVNYVGRSTFKGFPGTDRESPALVSDAMVELKKVYPISHFLVGGHSQGGFLTYSLLMNFPELIAGAFPISCGVIFQCEPDVYTDAMLRKGQRAVPLAIIHGKNDPAVGFSMGQYAATVFGEADWPAFRFFADDAGGHMFARLPVGPAIRWLESHASNDQMTLIDFAASQLSRKNYRDAIAALRRARTLNLNESQKRRAEELGRSIDAQASADAAKYLPLIREAKDGSWIDGFLAFRDDFEFADAAQDVMATFGALRASQLDPAKKAFGEARQSFQQGKQYEGYAKYREIVEKYYASPLYRSVKRWLAERK